MPLSAEFAKPTITASDIKAGRAKTQKCTSCHGTQGMQRLSQSASWEGSVEEFTRSQLLAFKNDLQFDPLMSAIAKQLSDMDIDKISAWFQSVSR